MLYILTTFMYKTIIYYIYFVTNGQFTKNQFGCIVFQVFFFYLNTPEKQFKPN